MTKRIVGSKGITVRAQIKEGNGSRRKGTVVRLWKGIVCWVEKLGRKGTIDRFC